MEALEFRELLDPRHRGEKDVADDSTLTATYHGLRSMVPDRAIDRLRRQ